MSRMSNSEEKSLAGCLSGPDLDAWDQWKRRHLEKMEELWDRADSWLNAWVAENYRKRSSLE